MMRDGRTRFVHLHNLGASHNDQAVNSQHLDFLSRRRDIYHGQGTAESRTSETWPRVGAPRTNMKRGIASSAFALRACRRGLFHREQMGDPSRDDDVQRSVARQPSGYGRHRRAARQGNAGHGRHDRIAGCDPQSRQHRQDSPSTLSWRTSLPRAAILSISPQHDLPTDPPMVTKVGELYVGRLPQIQRGVANIHFAVDEMRKIQPNADYDHLTMVGHSMGGDISMYFAKMYPDADQEGRDARQSARAVHDRRQIQDPFVPLEGSGVQDRSRRRSRRRGMREVRHHRRQYRLPAQRHARYRSR